MTYVNCYKSLFHKRYNQFLFSELSQSLKNHKLYIHALQSLSRIDFEDTFEVLQHLIIGSEGTLAFIKEITYYTVEDYQHKASALVFFENINEACDAVAKLKLSSNIKVDAVELMDNKALKSVQDQKGKAGKQD